MAKPLQIQAVLLCPKILNTEMQGGGWHRAFGGVQKITEGRSRVVQQIWHKDTALYDY